MDERVTNLEAGMEATSSDEVNKLKEENKQLMEKYEELNNKYEELYALIINKEPAANNDEVNELKQRVSDLEAKNKELNEKINLFEFEHNHMLNSNKEVLDAVSNVSEHTANMEQQLKEQKIYNEVKDKNISELRATIINQELTINNLNERFGTYIYKQQQRERELNTVKGATKNLVKATIITPINRFKKYLSNRKVNKYNKMIEKLNKLKEKELNKWNNEGEE